MIISPHLVTSAEREREREREILGDERRVERRRLAPQLPHAALAVAPRRPAAAIPPQNTHTHTHKHTIIIVSSC